MKQPKPAKSPEERVQRFLADYQEQWKAAGPMFAHAEQRDEVFKVFFPQWRDLLKPVKQHHFTDTSACELGGSFGSRPEYASKPEEHLRSETDGNTTRVLFRSNDGTHGRFHEYVVHAHDGDFKIFDIVVHYSDPALPFVDAATIATRQRDCAADAALIPLPEYEAFIDEIRNFTDREVCDPDDGEVTQTQVSRVGELTTSSGVLSVWDFGWDNDDTRPLARTVPPGTYPIDRVTAFGRNAAVRVQFNDNPPVSWNLANRVGEESDTVGVDNGCICIVDFAAYSAMTPRDKNIAYKAFDEATRPAVTQFPLEGSNVGFACDSGWGDGSYPVYWGLDAHGHIAQLVVDFSVLVRDDNGQHRHL